MRGPVRVGEEGTAAVRGDRLVGPLPVEGRAAEREGLPVGAGRCQNGAGSGR